MKGDLLRRVLTLLSGTAAAQLLPVLTAPIIARQFATAEFGIFGLFVATSAICATVANFKYENAILSARSRAAVRANLGLSILINLALGLVIALAAAIAISCGWLAAIAAPTYLALFLPVSLMLAGLTQSMSNVALRAERFKAVAHSRWASAAVAASFSLLAAFTQPTATALIAASIAGQLTAAGLLLRTSWSGLGITPDFRRPRVSAVARRNWRFAIFTSPADFLNSLASNLPALFLGALYGTAATGAYVLAQRIVGTPLMLIGSAFSDLYRQMVGQYAALQRPYWTVTLRMLGMLVPIGVPVLVVVLAIGKSAITAFLGSHWSLVGDICDIMIFVYVVRFVVSPLTFSFYLAHRHVEDLVLQSASAAAVWTVFLAARTHQWPLERSVGGLAIALTIVYLVYGVRCLQFSRASLKTAACV